MIAGRLTAGVVLGFLLACAVGGLITLLGPWTPDTNATWAVLAMLPVWVAAAAGAVACSGALRAWLWLGGANLIGHGVLWTLKLTGFAAVLEVAA